MLGRIAQGMGRPEDLDTIDQIANQACGHTICVFAEAFSWPAQSYLKKFRSEFEDHIREGRAPHGGRLYAPLDEHLVGGASA